MSKKLRKAFTIVELVIVIAVIAILAAVLIPTFSNIIDNSEVAADQATATNINTQISIELVDKKIESAEDLERIIKKVFNDDYYSNLAPKSANQGYNYWFNTKTNLIELKKYDESFETERTDISFTTNSFHENNFRQFGDYYLLDQLGSDFADVIKGLETLSSSDTFKTAISLLRDIISDEDNHHYTLASFLEQKLTKTAIISDAGIFRYADLENVTNVLFVGGTEVINSNLYIFNGDSVELTTPSVSAPIANVTEITLPHTIKSVEGNSLYFKEDKTVKVYGSFASIEEVESIFKAYSTNGIIMFEGTNGLVLEGAILKDLSGNNVGGLEYSNPVTGFDISVTNTDKIKEIDGTIYVAYDLGEFTLSATGFEPQNAIQEVVWSSTSEEGTSVNVIDENGKVTLNNETPDEFTITATAVAGGHSETVNVVVVKVLAAQLQLNGNDVLNPTTDNVQISYDGSVTEFEFSNFATTTGYEEFGLTLDTEITYETSGDLFKIEEDTLILNSFSGSQEVTIKVGEYLEKTITITVIDNSSSNFEHLFVNHEKYLYRLGNANAIKLTSLFKNDNPGNNVTLTIYDLAKKSGSDRVEIAESGTGFTAIYPKTLNNTTWSTGTIQFSGEGVAIIRLENSKGFVELLVEVVNGKNITLSSELSGSVNNILLNDISIEDGKTFTLNSEKTLFGNGFTFDITKGSTLSDPSHHGVITLNDAMLDNTKVIGKVYTEYVDKADTNYFMAAVNAKGNSVISNSYISNCQVAVRVSGESLLLENTTLYGGRFGNMQIRAGVVTLKNVTTINGSFIKEDVQNAIGAGILIYEESPKTSKIIVEGELIQYNWINKDDAQYLPSLASSFFSKSFTDNSYKIYRSTYEGVTYVNVGILNFNENIKSDNMVMPTYYSTISVSAAGKTGWMYSQNVETKPFTGINQLPEWSPSAQGVYKPVFKWSYPSEYIGGLITITFKDGETYTFDPNFLSVTKYNEDYDVFVSIDGVDYTDKKITFDQSRETTITYTVNDKYNYDVSGNASTISYEFTIDLYVIEQAPEAKEAEFKYLGDDMKKVQIGSDVYVMPNVNGTSDSITSTTINGTTVYVPVVTVLTDTQSTTNYYYAPLFNVITITDYNVATESGKYDTSYTGDYPIENKTGLVSGNMKELSLFGTGAGDDKLDGLVTYSNYGRCYKTNSSATKDQNAASRNVTFFFIDDNGNSYKYIIHFKFPAIAKSSSGGCVADGTLITLANGTQVPVENIKGDETLLVWNYVTGNYDSAKIAYVVNHNNLREEQQVLNLKFSDGSNIEIIAEHGFYSIDLNKWVYITSENVDQYVGNKFVSSYTNDSSLWKEITLVDYEVYYKETGVYEVVTFGNLACYTNGVLSVSGYTGGLLDIFDVNTDTMTYDLEKMQQEIEQYGLYTYEDFKDLVSEQVFDMYNAKYLKVAIGKGLITWDDVLALIEIYENNEIVPLG